MSYHRYTVNDFLQDDYFLQWVVAPTEESDQFWQQVCLDYPYQAETIAQAIINIKQLAAAEFQPASSPTVEDIWQNIEARTKPGRPDYKGKGGWRLVAGVATILLIMAGGVWFSLQGLETELADQTWTTYTNSTNKPVWLPLPDSSWVSLLPGSRLDYAIGTTTKPRETRLTGQAFFQVKKNPKWPFWVFTGKTQTRVLGTSFWIKEKNTSEMVEVDVVSGKVSVGTNQNESTRKNATTNTVVLLPNQRVVYSAKTSELSIGLVEYPVLLQKGITNDQLQFKDTPISTITARLSQLYGVPIVLKNQNLSNCMFTGDINTMSLYEKLNLICRSVNARYVVKETTIMLVGTGCQ